MSKNSKSNLPVFLQDLKQFAVQSQQFIQKCDKPNTKEFMKIAYACAAGFGVMGVVGYIIKLVFIPINNIILT